jgi:methionyl-tRNA formyltransferase
VRIVFWGTPEFAIPSLRALLGEGHDVVGVVTQPDRPAGRRRETRPPPVKEAALADDIPIFQPERARGPELLAWLEACSADLNIVVAYGQILKRDVLDSAELGSINVHASLLPELRGAAPINWAIARGYDTTGVTIMRMDERLDAGPILWQVPEPIGPDETAAELAGRLSEIGAEALIEALALAEAGQLGETPQDDDSATFAPMIGREDAHVDWARSAGQVGCHIRAFDDWPGAWARLDGRDFKIFRPQPAPDHDHDATPGTVLEMVPADPYHGMLVACGTGAVWIREVQPSGRRRMTTSDWLRGRNTSTGIAFD